MNKIPMTIDTDYPIESRKQDLLGRTEFAEYIAQMIYQCDASRGTVFSICGEWGSGKTSIKHLIMEYLKEYRLPNATKVIDFSPWMLSGTDSICMELFKLLGDNIKDNQKTSIKEKLKTYASRIQWGELLNTAPDLIVAINSGNIVSLITTILRLKLLKKEKVSSEKNLSLLKQEIISFFQNQNEKYLIIVDDIDRLDSDEITQLMRIIKSNCDFPNVVFLLLMQKDSVIAALDKTTHGKGEEFLEKIVQTSFDVPHHSDEIIEKNLATKLEDLIPSLKKLDDNEQRRWDKMKIDVFHQYFRTLRSVKRFTNALPPLLEMLKIDGHLIVNEIDFIALEIVRQTNHKIWQTIKLDFRDLLEPNIISSIANNPNIFEELDKRIENISAYQPLICLFDIIFGSERDASSLIKNKRALSHHYFPYYFTLKLPSGHIAEVDIRKFIKYCEGNLLEEATDVLNHWESTGSSDFAKTKLKNIPELLYLHDPSCLIIALANSTKHNDLVDFFVAAHKGNDITASPTFHQFSYISENTHNLLAISIIMEKALLDANYDNTHNSDNLRTLSNTFIKKIASEILIKLTDFELKKIIWMYYNLIKLDLIDENAKCTISKFFASDDLTIRAAKSLASDSLDNGELVIYDYVIAKIEYNNIISDALKNALENDTINIEAKRYLEMLKVALKAIDKSSGQAYLTSNQP